MSASSRSGKKKSVDFEKSLAELDELVEKMESGELTLEQSLEAFEKGISLTRNCQDALKAAEQKVEILMEKNGELLAEPFEPDEDEA